MAKRLERLAKRFSGGMSLVHKHKGKDYLAAALALFAAWESGRLTSCDLRTEDHLSNRFAAQALVVIAQVIWLRFPAFHNQRHPT